VVSLLNFINEGWNQEGIYTKGEYLISPLPCAKIKGAKYVPISRGGSKFQQLGLQGQNVMNASAARG
jgi:hypothetical protein